MPELIDDSQGAFVRGREILHNVLICQDLVRGYQRRSISPRCLLKIDLHKAFDSIHWGFIWDWLAALKFPTTFIKWIKVCISQVSYDLHLNGSSQGKFQGGRGLKQGDPLSPLLFVITMEFFSRMIKLLGTQGYQFHPGCKRMGLTHLLFADDLLIFSKADPDTIQSIMQALEEFKNATGLQVNMSKSQIVLGGCSRNLQEKCMKITGFKDSCFPIRYLGVPITACRLTKAECTELIEKIEARVRVWSTRSFSFAGRSRLINSVIFGMYSYWAAIFLLPAEVINKITQLSRNFLWSSSTDYKRPPHISWNTTCLPKSHGGLGVKDFGSWNKALTAKLVWAIAEKKDNLWVRWIHGKYLKKGTWWDYKPPSDSGWHWKRICFIKELFKEGCSNGEWKWQGHHNYTVQSGYKWLMGVKDKVKWASIPWTRTVQSRHGFTVWLLFHHRLPTKVKLSKHIPQQDQTCALCNQKDEDDIHLFLRCEFAKEVWDGISKKWQLPITSEDWDIVKHKLGHLKGKLRRSISLAYFAAGIYFIWKARNERIFKHQIWPATKVIEEILYQVKTRILYLNTKARKYSKYIEHIV